MDRIVCLIGESGSGKTTIAKMLEEKGYNVIKSYTTRLTREPNEWGHIFVDKTEDATWNSFTHQKDDVIAYTFYDGHHYWATKEQYYGKGTSIYVIDPVGVETLRKKVTDAEIVVIYLRAEGTTLYLRLLEREAKARGESIDRILKSKKDGDLEVFSGIDRIATKRSEHDRKKFKLIRCDWVVDNNERIEETLNVILTIIGGE